VATNESSRPDEAVEGSWSPRRPKETSTRAAGKAEAGGDTGAKDDKGTPDTEVLAQEIEQTREELAETLDAIADKVSPKRVVARNKKAAKEGAKDAVEVVKGTAASAAESVKGGVAAVKESVKEKVSGDSDPVRSPLTPATSVEVGSAAPISDDTVSIPGAQVPLEPAPTPGALADATSTVTEPAGSETPSYLTSLPPAAPSRLPVLAGAGAALLVLLLVLKRRRRW
jgi:hypothetical protein